MTREEISKMSDKKKGLNKADKHETPDSTTKFFEGEEVFVQNNDQFILGKIKEIDVAAEKCLVNIDSGEAVWALFKDLKTWTIDIDESPVKCNLCKGTHSRKNNVVVTCEVCFRGYHQKCYQPVIESADANWMCKKCRKKQNCQLLENTATQKTVSSTSKDSSLPQNCNAVNCNEKKRYGRNHVPIQTNVNAYKGQKISQIGLHSPPDLKHLECKHMLGMHIRLKTVHVPREENIIPLGAKRKRGRPSKVCIKSASPPFYADEQRKTTSKVKKKTLSSESKTVTTNSASDAPPPELPPTPPSSISAPETPQPLHVNGEAPISPTEDLTCMDFSDISPPTDLATCTLGELLTASKESPSDITLPLQLNHVIVDPLIRPTKRHLSEKDIKIVNGVVKKRRRFRRLSNVGIRPIDPVLPSTSTQLNKVGIHPTSIKPTIPNGSSADLKTIVYRYLNDENKRVTENERLNRFSGEEYRVCGKRLTLDGRVEYLVEWVKCTDPL